MTTVTEAAKRLLGIEDEEAIKSGDLARICGDPVLAQKFARRLVEAAREVSAAREWTIEDLRDVLEAAVNGAPQDRVRLLEGRYFRKRLREQCALSERYGDAFACVVMTVAHERDTPIYESILDAVTERLRRTDMMFLYKKRVAIILPRMGKDAVEPFVERLRKLVEIGAGEGAVETISALSFPNPDYAETQNVLDWAEDQLREI